ncbi:MAG TPA: hypothetical protein PJ982_09320, partial [Lacipirellulaceae bacterium]|nr:hypothetical protein [Lacipirellulaceae bacterium]
MVRQSATGLDVAEEQRVNYALRRQGGNAHIPDATPSQGSGGSAGGIGRSVAGGSTPAELRGPAPAGPSSPAPHQAAPIPASASLW